MGEFTMAGIFIIALLLYNYYIYKWYNNSLAEIKKYNETIQEESFKPTWIPDHYELR